MRNLPAQNANTPGQATSKVGAELQHEAATLHVSGAARYIDDIPVPASCLHGAVGMSTIASGRIKRLDLSRVRQSPGVQAVLTLQDIPGHRDIGPVFPGDPLLLDEGGVVQFHGQALFAVAADTVTEARQAARLAEVEYENTESNLDIRHGLQEEQLVRPSHTQSRGNAKAAIEASPRRLHGEFSSGGQEHMYLEGQVSLCIPTEDNGMMVYSSTQHPSEGQKLVAEVLGIPLHRVTVEVRRMGGGFGGKETHANQWACLAALLAWKAGCAIKLRLGRVDDFVGTGKRHPFHTEFTVGFDDSGLIQGVEMDLAGGCGYSPDLSDAIVDRAMFHADNAYYLPAARITGHRVKTNAVSNTAFRGFGGPQGMLATEAMIERIARAVGEDSLTVRQRNFYSAEDGRDSTHYGQKIEQHIIPSLVERLVGTSDYWGRRAEIQEYNRQSPVLKRGLALTPAKFGISFTVQHLNQAGALIHIYTDGSIQLNHGGTEMGQGLYTKVAQVVAHAFQVDIERIACTATRTDKVPNTSPTAASSGSDLNGMAALDAAEIIKKRLVDFAGNHFGAEPGDVCFIDNQVHVGQERYSFAEFIQLAYMNRISLSATGYYRTPEIHYNRDTASGRPFFYFANGAAVAEVLIDTLTGEYRMIRADICQDVGESLNPAIDIGQIEGGFIQGAGWLTTEELVWGEDGRLQTNSAASYKIPAIGDTPGDFRVELLPDSPNREATIFHSKAVGEPPLMLGIAVWSALGDAVASLSDYRESAQLNAPATPEQVFMACRSMRERN